MALKDAAPQTANRSVMPEGNPPNPKRAVAWLLVFGLAYFVGSLLPGGLYWLYLGLSESALIESTAARERVVTDFMFSSPGLALMVTVQAALVLPVLMWASHFRTQPWFETLALRSVTSGAVAAWLGVFLVYLVGQGIISTYLEADTAEVVGDLFGGFHWGLAIALAVVAPVIEELVFRGYLFQAWRHSRLGLVGTLLVTSAVFTSLHAHQYPPLLLIYLFVFAMLLGLARERTGSVVMPIIMHMINNAVGVLGLYLLASA